MFGRRKGGREKKTRRKKKGDGKCEGKIEKRQGEGIMEMLKEGKEGVKENGMEEKERRNLKKQRKNAGIWVKERNDTRKVERKKKERLKAKK